MKRKKWTTTKLIAAGSLGVLSLILSLIGAPITILSGVPGGSGVINALLGATITVLTAMVIQNFGGITISYLVFGLLALPLPILGTPGFLPKVLGSLFSGLISDITYSFTKTHKKLAAIMVGVVSQLSVGIGIFILGKLFNVPGIEKLDKFSSIKLVVPIILGFIILGIFGLFGLYIYNKIKNTSVVKRIQK